MNHIKQHVYSGERALFQRSTLTLSHVTFEDGESPLKESRNIIMSNNLFKWKYPLWYSHDIVMKDSTLLETARAGIWYTNNIDIKNTMIEAPKTFRRTNHIRLDSVNMPAADETLWNCRDIKMNNVIAKGDYFAMNSEDIVIDGLQLSGNYCFDGCKNVEVRNAKLMSKDAFWNCDNVTVYDSTIIGEYIGWNSKNLTFINCIIESEQGFCYIDKLKIQNTQLINTTLAFEYSTVSVDVTTRIDSVKNPISGTIKCPVIDELIMEADKINPNETNIVTEGKKTVFFNDNKEQKDAV